MIGQWILDGLKIGIIAFSALFGFAVPSVGLLMFASLIGHAIGHGDE